MNINFTSPINTLSYGYAGINILKTLSVNNNVSLFPIGEPQVTSESDATTVRSAMDRAATYDPTAPSIRLWHQFDLSTHPGKGPRIGYSIWELNRFTPRETYQMNQMDAIASCSQWACEVLWENGFKQPIFNFPLGVDRSIYNENIKPIISYKNETVFVVCGKLEVRKNHWNILSAFNTTFNSSDRVKLIFITYNPFIGDKNSEWESTCRNSKLGAKISVMPRLNTQSEIASIIAAADCAVLPSLAEGFCLPALEALGMGKDLITTNYSAMTEFADNNNAFMIDIDGLELAKDDSFFKGNEIGYWAAWGKKQQDQLCEYMRFVHKKKTVHGPSINQAGIETSKKYTWNATASAIESALSDLGVQ